MKIYNILYMENGKPKSYAAFSFEALQGRLSLLNLDGFILVGVKVSYNVPHTLDELKNSLL